MSWTTIFNRCRFAEQKRWLYRGGHPNWLAQLLNRGWAAIHALGIAPNYLVTLEVRGRKSGRTIRLPLAMVVLDGERYLVSMLGTEATWVRNVKAAGGRAVLIHGRREAVRLEEIAPALRPPVLKRYLQRAPGARPHIPVNKDAPLADFVSVAAQFPVFRVLCDDVQANS
ncbi:MAG: nitroreductase/quinone reductase family protein [Caldilineaceae bacterium]